MLWKITGTATELEVHGLKRFLEDLIYYLSDISGGAGNRNVHVTEWKLIAVSEYIATESNPTNEYQGYFEYLIRSLQLENPSNYQQGLEVFLMLKWNAAIFKYLLIWWWI